MNYELIRPADTESFCVGRFLRNTLCGYAFRQRLQPPQHYVFTVTALLNYFLQRVNIVLDVYRFLRINRFITHYSCRAARAALMAATW